MRIKLLANELIDGEIEYVSLVKHGANQQPFTIIKTEDLPEGGAMSTLSDKFKSLFGDEERASVAAFVVHTEVTKDYEPRIVAAGYSIADNCTQGNFTIYKQEGYDPDADGSLIAIDNN